MYIIPEINCVSCGQRVPIDRDCCPYCHTAIKSYWFEDQGNVKRAIPFSENGIDYLFIDGKKLSSQNLDEIPYALHKCLIAPKCKQSSDGFGRVLVKLAPQLFLGKQLARVFFGDSDSSDPPLPSQWDKWL